MTTLLLPRANNRPTRYLQEHGDQLIDMTLGPGYCHAHTMPNVGFRAVWCTDSPRSPRPRLPLQEHGDRLLHITLGPSYCHVHTMPNVGFTGASCTASPHIP